jgi:hypothetical protein
LQLGLSSVGAVVGRAISPGRQYPEWATKRSYVKSPVVSTIAPILATVAAASAHDIDKVDGRAWAIDVPARSAVRTRRSDLRIRVLRNLREFRRERL